MEGPKLTIDEQITDMQKKGITFEKTTIDDARKFLKENNYYFKLKAYGRNYTDSGTIRPSSRSFKATVTEF